LRTDESGQLLHERAHPTEVGYVGLERTGPDVRVHVEDGVRSVPGGEPLKAAPELVLGDALEEEDRHADTQLQVSRHGIVRWDRLQLPWTTQRLDSLSPHPFVQRAAVQVVGREVREQLLR
jgi:hypothetical protein